MDMILTDFLGHMESISNIIADNPQYYTVFEAELTRLAETVTLNKVWFWCVMFKNGGMMKYGLNWRL